MKARILLASIGAAVLAAAAVNVNAGEVYLSPRATGNQIKHLASLANDPNLVNTTGIVVVSPRTEGNQTRVAAGTTTRTTPAMACAKMMAGSPKTIQACAEHPATMPGCRAATVASVK